MSSPSGTPTTASGAGRASVDVDVGLSLSFFFKDKDWLPKLLIGSLFVVLGFALVGWVLVLGYAFRVARAAMTSPTPALPEWNDLGGIFVDGLRSFAVHLAHAVPIWLLMFILALAIAGGLSASDELSEGLAVTAAFAVMAGYVLFTLLAIVVGLYVPAAFARYVSKNDVRSAFDIVDNLQFVRSHATQYVLALLIILIASLIAQFGFSVFCIGILPAAFWSTVVTGYAFGRLARLSGNGPESALSDLVD